MATEVRAAYRFIVTGRPRSQKNSKSAFINPKTRIAFIANDPKVDRWRKSAIRQLHAQWFNKPQLTEPMKAVIVSYLAFGQRADADNLAAGPLDALQHAGVIKNDSQFTTVVSVRRRDKHNPRVEMLLFPDDGLSVWMETEGDSNGKTFRFKCDGD